MESKEQHALNYCMTLIVDNMSVMPVVDHLRIILTNEEVEVIKATKIPQNQRRELIDILRRKDKRLLPFKRLLRALLSDRVGQEWLANEIQTAYNREDMDAEFGRVSNALQPVAAHNCDAWQNVQQTLKNMYLARFQKVYPFSLPFTFDIENTWVSLALKDDVKSSQATEDHAQLLMAAFEKAKMLIIEGNPATGKTSLMRRLAYEWATGKKELSCFDLIIYAEFRDIRERTFASIADLVIQFNYSYEKFFKNEEFETLKHLLSNKGYCEVQKILVLLDGYDESSLDKQCRELSTYIASSAIQSPLMFHVVLTTRPGYLSKYRGIKGRLVFAEVLDFTTKEQKENYISKHFYSQEIENKGNIEAVHSLLTHNENLSKLAETPLFLTFICLVHERIIDGTLLELYCNIIWWLIDRHQQDFPDRDIPCSFGCHNDSSDKFETIQDHYLQFPQLHCLGNMALHNLKKDIFECSDYEQFNLQPITEQAGLLRKEKKHDSSFKLATSFHFPHRTIQEFLAAFYCFCSNDPTNEWLSIDSQLDTSEFTMNEFERFLLRLALSNKMPVKAEKREYYFERITVINLNITFDTFNTTAGFNSKLLNWFLSQCKNAQSIRLDGKLNRDRNAKKMLNDTSPALLSFSDLIKLHSLTFLGCSFEADSQLSITNCPSLKNLTFQWCEMKDSTNLGIATLPAINTLQFFKCEIDLATWHSITDAIRNNFVKYFWLTFGKMFSEKYSLFEDFNEKFVIELQKCSSVEQMEITIDDYTILQNDLFSISDLIKLHSLKFTQCTFSVNSQVSFTNCPSLKNLEFRGCEMNSSTIAGVTTLPAIDTVEFNRCNIDLTTWQSIMDQISNSSAKYLKLSADFFAKQTSPEFLDHLQKCKHIQQIHVKNVMDSIVVNDVTDVDVMDKMSRMNISNILERYEEEVAANLALTAQIVPALTTITISNHNGERLHESERLSERNREQIEKAGQQRNPNFSIEYVE